MFSPVLRAESESLPDGLAESLHKFVAILGGDGVSLPFFKAQHLRRNGGLCPSDVVPLGVEDIQDSGLIFPAIHDNKKPAVVPAGEILESGLVLGVANEPEGFLRHIL